MNWIEVKNTFYNLNRMGVTSVKIGRKKLSELEDLVDKNTDDGGSHNMRAMYGRRLLTFYGVRVEIED